MVDVVFSVMTALAMVVALGPARLRWRQRHLQLVRRQAHAVWRVELRRRACMSSHDDGFGGQSFPTPIEVRTLSLVVCELPLWTRTESIGLPFGCEARLEQLAAGDYDQHFTSAFRIEPPAGGGRQVGWA